MKTTIENYRVRYSLDFNGIDIILKRTKTPSSLHEKIIDDPIFRATRAIIDEFMSEIDKEKNWFQVTYKGVESGLGLPELFVISLHPISFSCAKTMLAYEKRLDEAMSKLFS
jgi:hypothetical protein